MLQDRCAPGCTRVTAPLERENPTLGSGRAGVRRRQSQAILLSSSACGVPDARQTQVRSLLESHAGTACAVPGQGVVHGIVAPVAQRRNDQTMRGRPLACLRRSYGR